MGKKKKKQHGNRSSGIDEYIEIEVNHGMWEYYLEDGPQYDTVNDCPIIPGETRFVERTRFKKVPTAAKRLMREYMCHQVELFWKEHRQIPDGGAIKKMRKASIDYLLHDFEIYVKYDNEVSHYLNECVTPTINKLLKSKIHPNKHLDSSVMRKSMTDLRVWEQTDIVFNTGLTPSDE